MQSIKNYHKDCDGGLNVQFRSDLSSDTPWIVFFEHAPWLGCSSRDLAEKHMQQMRVWRTAQIVKAACKTEAGA